MRLSRFTRFGHLRFTSKPSRAELIYRALVKAYGGNFATDGELEAKWFAQAMTIARARATLERARNQADPLKCSDLLPKHEKAYGITPGATDSMDQRRAVLASRYAFRKGAVRTSVTAALRAALGTNFLGYQLSALPGNQGQIPSLTPGAGPGTFKDPATSPRNFTILDRISTGLGTPQLVRYQYHSGDSSQPALGDTAVLCPGQFGRQEQVTIAHADENCLVFTPTLTHEPGELLAFGNFPFWMSVHKHALVVVPSALAADPETRRKVDDVMQRVATGVSTWDTVGALNTTTVYTLQVGSALGGIGNSSIGSVSYQSEL